MGRVHFEPPGVDFELPIGTKCINLYKKVPPYMRSQNGYGYPGILLEKDGKIQCHICGEWFEQLAPHVFPIHKINIPEYKKRFGFRKKDALINSKLKEIRKKIGICCSKYIRKIGSENYGHRQNHSYLTKSLPIDFVADEIIFRSKKPMASLIEEGLCPAQRDGRFDVIAKLKKQPTEYDVEQEDMPLLSQILKDYGSFEKYIKFRKTERKYQYKKAWDKARREKSESLVSMEDLRLAAKKMDDYFMIASIRNLYKTKGRVTIQDFDVYPSHETVCKRFGNLENALRESGIDPATWTMVG